MKPVTQIQPFALWLMRLATALFVLLAYGSVFIHFNLASIIFYLSTVFLVFSLLLFAGGFLKDSRLTVVASVVLILATGYHAFLNLKSGFDYNFGVYVMLGSILVYFLSNGNRRN